MNDMSSTIVAKSDQINAADLIGTNRTVTIKEVRIKAGEDQPVTVLIEGDKKAFRPCKGVRRLMVRVWGADASKYIGQSMTLFCDPSVTWAGKEEGGIRVSHMTGLDEQIVEYMRISRAATKPYKILPLKMNTREQNATQPDDKPDRALAGANKLIARIKAADTAAALVAITDDETVVTQRAWLAENRPELAKLVDDAVAAGPIAATEGRADEEHGDQFPGTDADPFTQED
jgi:hypothetical protein